MQSKTGVSLILCAVLIGIFGCDKFSDGYVNHQAVDSTQTTNLVNTKLSKGSNSKATPKEVSHTQVQSQIIKGSDHKEKADSAKVEPIISEKSDQNQLKQAGDFSTQAEEKPKAITKKQAKDFCHSDWVKQHYSCKEGAVGYDDTQEVVTGDLGYQCKILSIDPGLAAMLTVKEKNNDEGLYYPIIDLVDISHLRVLDHFEDKETFLGGPFYVNAYIQPLTDPISKKYHLFNFISWDISNIGDSDHWEFHWMNMYQYKNNHISKILGGMKISSSNQSQDADIEDKLPKSVKNRCVNEIEKEKINYRFVHNKTKNMPDIYLTKVKKHKWVRGYHIENPGTSIPNQYLCDDDKPLKVIKRKKDVIKKRRIVFDGKKYPIPKGWGLE